MENLLNEKLRFKKHGFDAIHDWNLLLYQRSSDKVLVWQTEFSELKRQM